MITIVNSTPMLAEAHSLYTTLKTKRKSMERSYRKRGRDHVYNLSRLRMLEDMAYKRWCRRVNEYSTGLAQLGQGA